MVDNNKDISLDEITSTEPLDDDNETNEGGIYETAVDEDSDAPEVGTPGHPGVDEDTA